MASAIPSGFDPFGLRKGLVSERCWKCKKDESTSAEKRWIGCGLCSLWAHVGCVKLGSLSEKDLKDFHYCCSVCAKELSYFKKGSKSEFTKEVVSLRDVIVSTIDSMKDEVIAKIEVSKETVTDKIVSVAAESSDSYADKVKRGKASGSKNLVIVEPANESMGVDDIKDLVAGAIGGGEGVVPTDTRFKRKKIIMNFAKEDDRKVAVSKVRDIGNVTVRERTRRLKPNITICNVVSQEPKEDLVDTLIRRNSYLQNIADVKSKIEFRFKKQANGGTEHYVFTVDPEVRKLIHDNGDRIFLTWSSYQVYDRYLPLICFHCQRYGHKMINCFAKKNNEDPVCRNCSGGHRSSVCQVKEPDQFKCINCTRLGSDDEGNTNHTVGAACCMVHRREVDRIRQDTDHGY